MNTGIASALAARLTVSVPTPALADDVSLGYDVDRFPSTALSMNACRAAIARGAVRRGAAKVKARVAAEVRKAAGAGSPGRATPTSR